MVTLLVSQTNPVGVRILKNLNSSLPLGPGLVQVLENLESPGKRPLVLESSGNLLKLN